MEEKNIVAQEPQESELETLRKRVEYLEQENQSLLESRDKYSRWWQEEQEHAFKLRQRFAAIKNVLNIICDE